MKKMMSLLLMMICVLSLAACGSRKEEQTEENVETPVNVDLAEVHQAVKDAYGETYYPNMPFDATMLADTIGLTEGMYEEFIAEGPMMSANIDMFIAVKAAEGQADAVEETLNAYRDYQINEAFQYPTNKVKVQASQVIRHGDYVFYVMLGDIPMEVQEQGDEAILNKAKEVVQVGVDTINGFFE